MPRPSQPHLSHRLRSLTLTSPPPTALFYARIWLALSPPTETEHESLHVLALAFLAAEEPYSALHLVRDLADDDARRPGCAGCGLLVARCCDALGRYTEGQQVLERAMNRGGGHDLPTLAGPSGTSNRLLLARMSYKAKSLDTASEQYAKALSEDPWLWEAFTGLCNMGLGAAPSAESLFPDPPITSISRAPSNRASRPPTLSPNPMPRSSTSEMPFLPKRTQLSPLGPGPSHGFFTPDVGAGVGAGAGGVPRHGLAGASTWDTPSVIGDSTFPTIPEHHLPLPVPARSRKPLPGLMSTFNAASSFLPASLRSSQSSQSGTTATVTPFNTSEAVQPKPPGMKRPRAQGSGYTTVTPDQNGHTHAHSHSHLRPGVAAPKQTVVSEREIRRNQRDLKSIEPNGEVDAPVRRSSRLKTTTVSTKHLSKLPRDIEKQSTRSRSTTSSTSNATATTDLTSPPTSQDHQLQRQADDWLRDIIRRCARAYRLLSLYQNHEAIREVDTLPPELQRSSFALTIYARASYELANYIHARRAFSALSHSEPYSLESAHLHSTLLWHLSDAPALSALSQNLIAVNKDKPEPWIAAGNCFSLAKDHDEAMRCFRRATQADPACAYAWTLCGYEAVEMEEYERAIGFYRSAIRCDMTHYNAWYGMGSIYLKMGKIKHAEHHFRRAAEINPTNAILLSCIGTVLELQDDHRGALHYYELACKHSPDSPMVAFKRIRVLVALNEITTLAVSRLEKNVSREANHAQNAIKLLEPLSRTAPDEAQVQFLLGKCYLRTGRRAEAMVALTNARELQPKLEGAVRATISANGEEVVDDEEE